MSFVIALDQGTTSSRAIVFDVHGNIVNVSQKEFQQLFPQPGWVEHDPVEIWETQVQVMDDVVAAAGLHAADISAIGITNQRETTVVWNRSTGQPIYNAIVWQDRRTAQRCDELRSQGLAEDIQRRTGLVLDAYFSATKLQWILENVEGARALAMAGELAFGTIDSWLVWKLTDGQVHVTDASNASRTMLMNIHTGDWDDALLELFQIPRSLLPEIRDSSEVYGEVAAQLPLAAVPLAGIAGDQQAALFGQLCNQPGLVKNTYGTGCFMLMYTGEVAVASQNNLLTTIAWRLNGQTSFALEGSVFIGGALIQWLRDGLQMVESAADIESLANETPDNGGVYFVPALSGLGAPVWDPYARGCIFGLTRGTTKSHLARAALEGIAYQVADLLEAMQADAGISLAELRVDGGAAANNLLLQFQADLLNVPVVRPSVLETTARGVAYLAGLAVGVWKDMDELKHYAQVDHTFSRQMAADKIDDLQQGWNRAIKRSLGWVES